LIQSPKSSDPPFSGSLLVGRFYWEQSSNDTAPCPITFIQVEPNLAVCSSRNPPPTAPPLDPLLPRLWPCADAFSCLLDLSPSPLQHYLNTEFCQILSIIRPKFGPLHSVPSKCTFSHPNGAIPAILVMRAVFVMFFLLS